MLSHPTLDLLHELGLSGMASGFTALDANPEARALGHAEWLGLLLDHEATARRQKRFETRARAAPTGARGWIRRAAETPSVRRRTGVASRP